MINNKSTAVFKTETPLLDKIKDTESNETEQDESYRCISVSESKNEKGNAVFINMPAKSDACCLLVIEKEKEDGAIEMTARAQSLDFKDHHNDEEVRDYYISLSSTIVSESKNNDESKGRDTKAEEDDLEIESVTGKGSDIKFDTINAVQEEDASLDNSVEHNLEEKGITNKGIISLEVLEESNVQMEHSDISDATLMENECKDLVSTTESENQITTSEASGQGDNAIDEERFLYR